MLNKIWLVMIIYQNQIKNYLRHIIQENTIWGYNMNHETQLQDLGPRWVLDSTDSTHPSTPETQKSNTNLQYPTLQLTST